MTTSDAELANLNDEECLIWRTIWRDWPPGLSAIRLAGLQRLLLERRRELVAGDYRTVKEEF